MQVSPPAGAQYDMAVAKKVQTSVKEQGQDALKLIESATAPQKLAASGHLGTKLNVVA